MFNQSKWDKWYDEQPDHIKRWIDQDRPIWYDRDMWKAGFIGVMIGILIGLCF